MPDQEQDFLSKARIAKTDVPCTHCGATIDKGWTMFRLLAAWHGEERCTHWICLTCFSSILRRWTRESVGIVYREPTVSDAEGWLKA